jgi:hypothetical protein
VAQTAKRAALEDAQDIATSVIYAEAKLGELLKAIPPKPTIGFSEGNRISLPPGISKAISHQAQTIANNPEKVEQAIARAKREEKIPTPDMVYKIIKGAHVSHNSGENEWYTSGEYIEAVRNVMGSIAQT